MFQLREDHNQAFRDAAVENFELRGLRHLRRRLARETSGYNDQQLTQRIRECTGRAGAYGLTSEQQVMHFVDATYIAGEDFDRDPRASRVLVNSGLPGDVKATLTLVEAKRMAGQ